MEKISETELISDKLGIRKNFKPFNAFGNFITLIDMTRINIARSGRKTLLIFSIPPDTPFITIVMHIIAKMICQITGSTTDSEKFLKYSEGLSTDGDTIYLNKYFKTHPPITL